MRERDTIKSSWSRLMQWRSECYQRFGAIQGFPIRTPHEQLAGLLTGTARVLDVGAGAHKPFLPAISQLASAYFSLDTDPDGTFDFRSFADMPPQQRFDLVLANQVLEHLSVDDAFDAVCSAFDHLEIDGYLIATVPNAAHPVRQWDCTHITPWPANDLYSLLRSAGFEVVSMCRYNKVPLTTDPLKRWVVETVCAEFRVDWCDSVMATGKKLG
jgi:hypothetical protein